MTDEDRRESSEERRSADAQAHREIAGRLGHVEAEVVVLRQEVVDHIHPEIDRLLDGQEEMASALLGPMRSELLGGGRDRDKGIIARANADRASIHADIELLKDQSRLTKSERLALYGILVTVLVTLWAAYV